MFADPVLCDPVNKLSFIPPRIKEPKRETRIPLHITTGTPVLPFPYHFRLLSIADLSLPVNHSFACSHFLPSSDGDGGERTLNPHAQTTVVCCIRCLDGFFAASGGSPFHSSPLNVRTPLLVVSRHEITSPAFSLSHLPGDMCIPGWRLLMSTCLPSACCASSACH